MESLGKEAGLPRDTWMRGIQFATRKHSQSRRSLLRAHVAGPLQSEAKVRVLFRA